MKCERIRELLSPYIDGVINEKEKILVENHIASCAKCRQELEDYQLICGLMHELESPRMPDGFNSNLQQRLLNDKNKIFSSPIPKTPKKSGWVAAGLAGIALAAGIYASSFLAVGDYLFSGNDFAQNQKKPNMAIEDIIQRFQDWKPADEEKLQEEKNILTAQNENTGNVSGNIPTTKPNVSFEEEALPADGEVPLEKQVEENQPYSAWIRVEDMKKSIAQIIEIANIRGIQYSILPDNFEKDLSADERELRLTVSRAEAEFVLAELEELGQKIETVNWEASESYNIKKMTISQDNQGVQDNDNADELGADEANSKGAEDVRISGAPELIQAEPLSMESENENEIEMKKTQLITKDERITMVIHLIR